MKYSKNILTINSNYKHPKGGIAQVVNVYSRLYNPFYHVATKKSDSKAGKIFDTASAILKTFYFFLFKDIKIVHIHGASYGSFWRKRFIINLSKIFRKKIVYHIHGAEFHLFYKKYPKVVKKTLLKCDMIVALSSHWKIFFKETIAHPRIEIIENIIENPNKLKKPNDQYCHFLFLGFLGKRKGIYDLLKVIYENQEIFRNNIKLHIGGNGEVEEVTNYIKDNNIDDIVAFEGWVSGDKKYQLLSQADVYILPSYNEGLPISILEAMSYKLPVISTPVGGIPEVIKHNVNGILVEPGNLIELKNAMIKMYSDEAFRKTAGNESYKRITAHLPTQVEKKLEAIYEELLND